MLRLLLLHQQQRLLTYLVCRVLQESQEVIFHIRDLGLQYTLERTKPLKVLSPSPPLQKGTAGDCPLSTPANLLLSPSPKTIEVFRKSPPVSFPGNQGRGQGRGPLLSMSPSILSSIRIQLQTQSILGCNCDATLIFFEEQFPQTQPFLDFGPPR